MQETTARVQFDKKYLIALVLPLVIEQVLAVTVGMADMIMVSGAGDTAVSGVSLVNTISNLLIYIFNALATGGAVVAAQALGAKKKKTGQIVANQLVLICLIVSVVISAVCIVFDRAILTLIYGKVEQAVMDQAVTYFFITGFSFPFIAVYDGASSLLRSMGKASISLFVSAIMNGLNILFNAIFVFGYNMGIAGVGYGTLISRVVAGIVVVFILRNEKYDLHIDKYFRFGWDGQIIGKILRIGIPSGIDNGMFQIGKLSVSSLTSTLGTSAIAANAVAGNITTFLNVPANAVGMAVLTVIGQCLGAGEKEQAKHYARRFLLVAYAGAWIMNLSAFFFLNRITLSWFNLSPESNAMALQVMVWFNIISLFIWPSSFTLPNILRAAGDATFTMTVSVFSMWVFRVGFCYLMVLGLHQGNLLSIWGGMFLDWLFRSLFFAIRFFKGSWLEKKVI